MSAINTETILDTKILSEFEGGVAQWVLVADKMNPTGSWIPVVLDEEGDVVETPVWMPLPGSQQLFLNCPIFEALYEGTRGPGKTLSLIMDFAKDCGKGFGKAWRGVLFRREYKDLDDVVKKIEEWFPKMFPGFQFNKSKSEYAAIWPTGEKLLLRHLDSEEDYDNYHGHEYPWIGFEELTQWENDKAYRKMFSCCRSGVPGINCRVRATTNPYGVGHNWVKKRFGLPHKRGKVIRIPGEMPRVAIHGSIWENFLLLHVQPEYPNIIRQAASNPAEEKAWLEGSWNVTAGGMFDDIWDPAIHIVPNFKLSDIPRGWTISRAYDHGQSSPFAVGWWLESNGEPIEIDGKPYGEVRGDLFLWMEWYGCKIDKDTGDEVGLRMSAKKIAIGILDLEDDEGITGRVIPGPADNQIFNNDADKQNRSLADDMEDVRGGNGVIWERSDKSPGSRKRGYEKIRDRLEGAKAQAGFREEPGIFVCERCEFWIEHIPPAPRDKKDPDELPDGWPDHDLDMTRYRVAWEPPIMWKDGF